MAVRRGSCAHCSLSIAPPMLRNRRRERARLVSKGVRCSAVDDALHDALANGRHTEKTESQIRKPQTVRNVGLPRRTKVKIAIRALVWNSERREIEPRQPTKRFRRKMPREHMIRKVGHGIAKGREFPIDHGDNLRL